MSESAELIREAPPASPVPEIIYLPPPPAEPEPPPARRNGRTISTKPGSQISRRRKVKDPRSERLDLRVTPEQRAAIKEAAQDAGLSVAAFICLRTLDSAGPRAHRNPSAEIQLLAQMRAEMSKRGGNLNQAARSVNEIRILADEGERRGRLIELLDEALELLRPAIAENRETCAELDRLLGLRPDTLA